jgi:MOSC domain-containing protein YiiM
MRLTHPETLRGLVHRAGLIAEVLNDGELRVEDLVKVEPAFAEDPAS